jgi:hypothetical protein
VSECWELIRNLGLALDCHKEFVGEFVLFFELKEQRIQKLLVPHSVDHSRFKRVLDLVQFFWQ